MLNYFYRTQKLAKTEPAELQEVCKQLKKQLKIQKKHITKLKKQKQTLIQKKIELLAEIKKLKIFRFPYEQKSKENQLL